MRNNLKLKYILFLVSVFSSQINLWAQKDSTIVNANTLPSSPTLRVGTEYLLGPGDVLEIYVYWGYASTLDNYKLYTVEVLQNGEIYLPVIGSVPVNELTSQQLEIFLSEKFKKIINQPKVIVKTVKFVSHKVVVYGEVQSGIYPLKTDTKITEFLSSIGGVRTTADQSNIRVSRKNGKMIVVDLLKMLNENDLSQNIILEPDDLILVPAINENKVMVLGEVSTPGVVPLNGKLSLVEALVKKGGGRPQANLEKVKLIRFTETGKKIYTINIMDLVKKKKSYKVYLKPGDIVYVPNRRDVLEDMNKILRTVLPTLQTAIIVNSVL